MAASTSDTPPPPFAAFFRSFVYAAAGLGYTMRTQRNMRVHVAIAVVAAIVGVFLRISLIAFAILALTIATVLVAEMFNTVIEACLDIVTPEYHPLAKIAKDVAAGAVLISSILAVVIGLLLFLPPILARLHR